MTLKQSIRAYRKAYKASNQYLLRSKDEVTSLYLAEVVHTHLGRSYAGDRS